MKRGLRDMDRVRAGTFRLLLLLLNSFIMGFCPIPVLLHHPFAPPYIVYINLTFLRKLKFIMAQHCNLYFMPAKYGALGCFLARHPLNGYGALSLILQFSRTILILST